MRNVPVQEFEQHPADFISEVEAGSSLTLVRGSKAIVTLAPTEQRYPLPEGPEREAAIKEFFEMMDKGFDLKGLHINRDELYDDAI